MANGDIVDASTAKIALEQSGADGVMVGRGAQGKPWLLAQIGAELFGGNVPNIPHGNELIEIVSGHYEAMLSFYGAQLGSRVARKHLGWYMDGVGTPAYLRRAVLTTSEPATVMALLPDALTTNTPREDAA